MINNEQITKILAHFLVTITLILGLNVWQIQVSAQVTPITDKIFDEEVLESNTFVLVEFYAPWCGPCRMVAPVVDEIAEQYAGRVKVVKVNADENPRTVSQYNIRSVPTLILFKKGQKVDQIIGAVPKATLVDFIEKHLGSK
ncbi:Thioredoxin-1 (modular protein) [Microcystis aeruginosa PCC 9717]|jgi:thioredoxin 1|uniref:Thioredoxin n=1 Tax=Microcystis aeruginosa PCC 9717 TaxID=1160286 RepID=I4FUY4_MICAE|nr:Thioredoxin-1 (modular protein) [Microcystis aeruginosa PCC 9717]